MCGIVGFVNKDKTQYFLSDLDDWFREALRVDTLRGAHATGVATMTNHNWEFFKKSMNAWDFLQFRPADNIMTKAKSSQAAIGHNRHATVGKINDSTAHPFNAGTIVGVHNGTLFKANQEIPDFNKFDTDSEALINSINKLGPVPTFEKAKGAFAVVWFDADENTINFIRNDERPLHYAFSSDNQTLFYASEAGMIEWLCERNNIAIDHVYSFKVGTLYTMDAARPDKGFETTEVDIKENYAYGTAIGYGGSFNSYTQYVGTTSGKNNKKNKGGGNQNKMSRLQKSGYYQNENIQIRLTDFQKYASAAVKYGKATGRKVNGRQDTVVVHSMTQDVFDELNGKVLDGQVSSISEDGSVIVSRNSLRESNIQLASPQQDTPFQGENVVALPEWDDAETRKYPGPTGDLVTIMEFDRLVEEGCAYCGAPIWPEDAWDLHWFDGRYPVCAACQTEVPEIRNF